MARDFYSTNYNPDTTREEIRANRLKEKNEKIPKKYVRYDEGAELYSMSRHSFMALAAEAGAVRKINRLSLVNIQVFEDYIETFAV